MPATSSVSQLASARVQGLRLQPFTETGWFVTPEGKYYIAANPAHSEADIANTSCWWAPPGMACADYYAQIKGSDGNAIPLQQAVSEGQVTKNDDHDTGAAAKWREYYSQEIGDMVHAIYQVDFEKFGYSRETFE